MTTGQMTDMTATFATPWGNLTFDELDSILRPLMFRILSFRKGVPEDMHQDAVQEGLFRLWVHLTDDPNWIMSHGFTKPYGLAYRISLTGGTYAYQNVEKLYRERVATFAEGFNLAEIADGERPEYSDTELEPRLQYTTDFWREHTVWELRDNSVLLDIDGLGRHWQELADIHIDLDDAIGKTLDEVSDDNKPAYAWGFLCALLGVPYATAAFELGLTPGSMEQYMHRSLRSLRKHFSNYLVR